MSRLRMPRAEREALLLAIAQQKAEASLYEFLKQAWHVVEPAYDFVPGRHIEAMCQHFEAVLDGRLKNLIVCVPPGSTKSVTSAVMMPAWAWTRDATKRFLCTSHSGERALADSVKCRRLIESDWYQTRWPHVKLEGDQNVKGKYDNTCTGFRQIVARGGSTGFRGDVTLIDDPHSVKKVESDAERRSVISWHDNEWYNRVNDYNKSGRIVVGQRVHDDDLIAHLLETGLWELLLIPEEFEPDRRCTTSIGWTDPRTEEGEWLRLERFGPANKQEAVKTFGQRGYAAQHQQRPVPAEGAMFKREWFTHFVDRSPGDTSSRCRAWDKAATQGGGDFTAGVRMSRRDVGGISTYYIEDVKRDQLSVGQRNELIKQTAELDAAEFGGRFSVDVVIEKEGGSGGKESGQFSLSQLAHFPVSLADTTGSRGGSKEVRAGPLAIQAEAGNVVLVRGEWNSAFLDELTTFPLGKHDDQVDAAAHAFNHLALKQSGYLEVEGSMLLWPPPDEEHRRMILGD